MIRKHGQEGLSEVPTYLELINAIQEDRLKIHLPNRKALWAEDSPYNIQFGGNEAGLAVTDHANYNATGQQMPWVPPGGQPQSFIPRPMTTNVSMGHGNIDLNAFGGFPGGAGPPPGAFGPFGGGGGGFGGGPAPMDQSAVADQQQMRTMGAQMHAQAAAWAHVAPPIVVAPPDPTQADDVMAHENGGPPAPPTGTIQEGLAGIVGSVGAAIASQVTGLYDQGVQHLAERAGRYARRRASQLAAPWLRAPMPSDLAQPLLRNGAAEGLFAEEAAAGAGAFAAEAAAADVGLGAAAAAAGTMGAALLPAAAAGLATAAVVAAGSQVLHHAGDLFRNQNATSMPPHVAVAHQAVNGHVPGAPEIFRPPHSPQIGGGSAQPVPIHGSNSTVRSYVSDKSIPGSAESAGRSVPGSAESAESAKTRMYVPTFPQPADGPPAVVPGEARPAPLKLAKKSLVFSKKKKPPAKPPAKPRAKAPIKAPAAPDEPNAPPVLPIQGRVSIRKKKPETYENEGKRRKIGEHVSQPRQRVSIRKPKAPAYEQEGKRRRVGEYVPKPTQKPAPPKVIIVPHESQPPRPMNKKPVLPVKRYDIGPIATAVR